jgi:hypothetical protein
MYQHGKTLSIPAILQIYDCLTMPVQEVVKAGISKQAVQSSIKIAAILNAVAQALVIEN